MLGVLKSRLKRAAGAEAAPVLDSARGQPPASSSVRDELSAADPSRNLVQFDKSMISVGESRRGQGLSAKLVVFVVVFVMLAEVLVLLPSLAMFRVNWLNNRLQAAYLASLSAAVTPEGTVPTTVKQELLRSAEVRMVILRRTEQRRLILEERMERPVSATFDLRSAQQGPIWLRPVVAWSLIQDAVEVFTTPDDALIRFMGFPGHNVGDVIEVVMPNAPLRAALTGHSLNILGLSIIIAVLTAIPIYLLLNRLFVRPVVLLTRAMGRFRQNPEDASRIIVPSARLDEIGIAERELQHMQIELAQTLNHKSRLAALGLAVSKINHDLRNLLANAQLLSDRLATVREPTVERLAPKLVASIDRAIRFCNNTLQYGRAAEPPPRREPIDLRTLIVDVGEGLAIPERPDIGWIVDVPHGLVVHADRDQMYRVFTNLVRNSLQALTARSTSGPVVLRIAESAEPAPRDPALRRDIISVTGRPGQNGIVLDIRDTGPGLPEAARRHLFKPFQGSTRRDGTGLGLSIVHEIVTAHGGTIDLIEYASANRGTHFRIQLPHVS